jgi:pimeloyl-ACP methyl ester carboxylesterase
MTVFWGARYPRSEFDERLAVVRSGVQRQTLGPAGHMVHHDQPEALAACVEAFLR